MNSSIIQYLKRLRYTPREAAFLALVGASSGFFLRRQYGEFLRRGRGALLHQLIRKATTHGHLETLDCGRRRHLYHLKSKTFYRLLGEAESSHRRVTGDDEIRARLMVLDYVLESPTRRWMTLESEKIAYLHRQMEIPLSDLPHREASDGRVLSYFPDQYPIALGEDSLPSFTYFDVGTITVSAFDRHLDLYKNLFLSLGSFELVYVAANDDNFSSARKSFNRIILGASPVGPNVLLPHGIDHLVSFLEAQQLWNENSPRLSGRHVHILTEGEKLYCRREHDQLAAAWGQGQREFNRTLRQLGSHRPVTGKLITYVLERDYPLFKKPPQTEPITEHRVEVAV